MSPQTRSCWCFSHTVPEDWCLGSSGHGSGRSHGAPGPGVSGLCPHLTRNPGLWQVGEEEPVSWGGAAPMGPSLHPRVTHPETQCSGRGGALLTHSRAIAAGQCDIAETDPQVHAVGAKCKVDRPRPLSPTLPTPAPAPNWADRGELDSGGSLQPPRIPPHQTKWPLAQLGCSRSMARGRIETSWETYTGLAPWRTGSPGHRTHENVRLERRPEIWLCSRARPSEG